MYVSPKLENRCDAGVLTEGVVGGDGPTGKGVVAPVGPAGKGVAGVGGPGPTGEVHHLSDGRTRGVPAMGAR